MSTSMLAVDDLVLRLSQDVDAAFEEVVGRYQQAVLTTASRLSDRSVDAEDLAAEAFLQAYRALRSYSSDRVRQLSLRPWLITIVLNLHRNQVRSAVRHPTKLGLGLTAEPRSLVESPERATERHETEDELARLLATLPEAQRTAVVLRHVVGLSTAEVAQVLSCPEGTVKSHLWRGLSRLRTLMSQEDFR